MARNRLIFNENPLVILPEFARKIGLNESIIVQQINYWLTENEKAKRNFKDGYYWTYNSYKEWQQNFPFWSESTIKRTITRLENCGLLITGNYNKLKIDRTKWYRLNDELLSKVEESPLGQIDLTIISKWYEEQIKLTSPLPEINSEINDRDYPKKSPINIGVPVTTFKDEKDFIDTVKKHTEDGKTIHLSKIIYKEFKDRNYEVYRMTKEQEENYIKATEYILKYINCVQDVENILDKYFERKSKYYSIVGLTDRKTLGYLISKSGLRNNYDLFSDEQEFKATELY